MTAPQNRDPDRSWVRPFVTVAGIACITVMGIQAARPMATYRAIGLGASPVEIGLVQSSFALLPMFMAVAFGRWVDRIGEFRILILGCGVMAVGALVAALAASLPILALGQLLMGFGLIASAVAVQASVANRGPASGRVSRFGWFSVAVSVGQTAGPAIAGLLVGGALMAGAVAEPAAAVAPGSGQWGLSREAPAFLFAALAAGVGVGLALVLPDRDAPHASAASAIATAGLRAAAVRVLHRPGIAPAMFVSIAVTAAIDIVIAYLPAHGTAYGLSVGTVGGLLAMRAGASLVSRVFMGRLSDRLGVSRLLFVTTLIPGAAVLLLPFAGSSVPVLIGLMIVVGLGLGIGQPLTIAWIAERAPREERGLALGVRLTGNLAGLLIVPTAVGVLAGASSIEAVWIALAGMLGLGAGVAWRTPFAQVRPESATRLPFDDDDAATTTPGSDLER